MPNPGITPGSKPAWLLPAGAGTLGIKANTRTEEPQECSQDAPKLSTTADLDLPFTVWPTQPAWMSWSPKTRRMRPQGRTASSGKGSQQGFRNGSVTHMAPKMQKTSCNASSYKQPPRQKTWERLALWAGLARLQSLGVSLMNFPSQ